MYALSLDEKRRILSATDEAYATPAMPLVETLPAGDLFLYRFENGEFVEDADRKKEQEEQAKAAKRAEWTAQLRSTDSAILEGLESLLSCTTLSGFLSALIKAATALKDTLEIRKELRDKINNGGEK